MADGEYRPFKCGACGIQGLQSKVGAARKKCLDCKPKHKKRVRATKPCKQCGAEMNGTPLQLSERVFCSQRCNAEDRKKANVRVCEVCSSVFHRRPGGNQLKLGQEVRYCSNRCKFESQKLPEQEVERREQEKARAVAVRKVIAALRQVARQRVVVIRWDCAHCGASFDRAKGQRSRLCNDCRHAVDAKRRAQDRKSYRKSPKGRAMKAAYKAQRRAKERIAVAHVDPILVLERDNWRCKLCGVKTPRALRGTYADRAPEVDHIVSLADGGSHEYGNLQCACRRCNLDKGRSSRGQI